MIRFTVVWSEPANDRLAILWMSAPDRNAVTAAANAIDAALASDPLRQGEPLHEGLRSFHVPPLHVLFTVEEPDRLVRVVSVRSNQEAPGTQVNGRGPSAEQL
jgi:plasmid stabilization system protein ParE